MITYRELAEIIAKMSDEQKDSNVTVFLSGTDEYIGSTGVSCITETDVLDKGHPVIDVDF
jgi:hypothetical protein